MEKTAPLNTRPQAVSTGMGIAPTGRILSSRQRGPVIPIVDQPLAPEGEPAEQHVTIAPRTSWKMLLGMAVFAGAAVYASSAPITPSMEKPVEQLSTKNDSQASVIRSAKQVAAHYHNASYVRDVYTFDFAPAVIRTESEEHPALVRISHAPHTSVRPVALNRPDAAPSAGQTARAQATREHSPAMIRRVQEIIKYYAPKGVDPKPLAERIVWESARQGYDPLFVAAVIKAESRFNSSARSHVGARGLMQIMPATGRWLAGKHNIDRLQLYDRDQNLKLGIAYLKELEKGYGGDKVMTLVAYNWGPGHVQSAGRGKRRIPGDVMRYAVRILNDYRRWRGDAVTPARAIG